MYSYIKYKHHENTYIGVSLTAVLSTVQLMHSQHTSEIIVLLSELETLETTKKTPLFTVNSTHDEYELTINEMVQLKHLLSNYSNNDNNVNNMNIMDNTNRNSSIIYDITCILCKYYNS